MPANKAPKYTPKTTPTNPVLLTCAREIPACLHAR